MEDGEDFTGTISSYDLGTGLSTLTFGSDTDIVNITLLDLSSGVLRQWSTT